MVRVIVVLALVILAIGAAAFGQAGSVGTTQTSSTNTTGSAASTESFWSAYLPLIILLVAFGLIFYFMLIRPQKKRQQEMTNLIAGLKRGDKVITAGGIIGEIDSIGDTSVVLILEEGAKLRMSKMSIVRKIDK